MNSFHAFNTFSKRDLIALLELIHRITRCTSEDAFRETIAALRNFVPYEHSLAAMGDTSSFHAINVNYPHEWGENYLIKRWDKVDPVFIYNFTNFNLLHWDEAFLLSALPSDYVPMSYDFGLKSGYTHGVRNSPKNGGSIFTFSGKNIKRDKRVESVLSLITPHLHQALARILGKQSQKNGTTLSVKEQEIVKWLKQGKTTWDISVILGISERTVKFHISNIMQKLDASSRTHAVAIAIEQNLIDIE